ncbi:MAG: restriction endonuclease subunit S [Acidobacteriota bacterium]|nr:restriction endonuclease subunit S [Acidobacteriota bacterium]
MKAFRRFKPYPAYKDSGVEWLGKIPAHWEVKRLKRVFRVVNGSTPSSAAPACWDGEIPWVTPEDLGDLKGMTITSTRRTITESGYWSCGTTLVPSGSLVLSTRAPIGHLAMAGVDLCTNQGCRSLVFRDADSREFFYYELLAARPELESFGQGSTFRELAKGMLEDLEISIAPEPEQRTIAAFLDRETARIDALVAKKERLIELLQEKRTALITRTVTKGLYPTVPMKDSGVEWLGEIPAHWEVKRIKAVARLHTGGTPAGVHDEAFDQEGVPWVKPDHLRGDCGISIPDRHLSTKAAMSVGPVRAGSVLVCGIGTVGKVGHAPVEVCTNQQINAISFDSNVIDRYGHFITFCLQQEFSRRANKVTIPICNKSEMGEALLCIPPLDEQRTIAAFLDRETARIDALVAKVREAVDRLKELRTAVISAAVTGKIDVREEVA